MKTATKAKWKILARHKWTYGATITESVMDCEDINTPTVRRFVATIRGFRGWHIWQGEPVNTEQNVGELVKYRVEAIRARIDRGDDAVFHEKNAAERSEELAEAARMRRRDNAIARTFAGRGMRRPNGTHKHLIAVSSKGHGYFVVNNRGEHLDRETFKEIVAEATAEGVTARPFHIFGATCAYAGPAIDFMQYDADEYR